MKKITVFQCGYCRKILRTDSGMRKHERQCFSNPLTKSCRTCINLSEHCPSDETDDVPGYSWDCSAGEKVPFESKIIACRGWAHDKDFDNPFGETRMQNDTE